MHARPSLVARVEGSQATGARRGESGARGSNAARPRASTRADPRATMKKPAAKAAKAAKAAPKAKAKAEKKKPAPQMPFRGYWDDKEEQALRDAVQKHGIGAWEKMRHDADFKVLKCVPPPLSAADTKSLCTHGAWSVNRELTSRSGRLASLRVGSETFPRLDPSPLLAPSARAARDRARSPRSTVADRSPPSRISERAVAGAGRACN